MADGRSRAVVSVIGRDQKGVVARISTYLASSDVNIEDIDTHVGPDGSFRLRLALAVPRQTPVTMLREYLSVLCNELGIKGTLTEA